MNKIISTVLILLFSVAAGFSEDAIAGLSETQIKTLVCHKWKLTFLEYKGNKKEIPAKLPQSLLVFLPDGKMQEFQGKDKYDGTWTYNHATKTVITVDKDGTENHKIINLSNEEFVMNGKYQGFSFNMGFKRVD